MTQTPESQNGDLLNGGASLSGKAWQVLPVHERMALALSQRFGFSELLGRILAGRGFNEDQVEGFLNPHIRNSLPDPSRFKGMDDAVARIVTAIDQGEKIAVFGDYDVDGATSSAVLIRYFQTLGMDLRLYIPDRLSEGYGPNIPALQTLTDEGVKVVITVDCGTLSYQPLKFAKDAGLDVIVLDHHKAEPALPEAIAVVNPNRLDEDQDIHENFGHMAAVGMTFLFVVGLNRALRQKDFFGGEHVESDLLALLDIVALGTVCDVVSLTGINRAFVAQGLKVMAGRQNIGLRALADASRMDEAPNVYHLGFLMGPRVNAGGRVGESYLGAELLSLDIGDEDRAEEIALQLDGYNQDRQAIEAQVLEEATQQALAQVGLSDGDGDGLTGVLFVAGKGWHPGVVGIVASRLKERFNRPTFVLALTTEEKDGKIIPVGKCSARSIYGVDIGNAVINAAHEGLILAGGGHAMAAGLTVEEEKLNDLKNFLDQQLVEDIASARQSASLKIDAALSVGGATSAVVDDVEKLAPFGMGNPTPRFAILDAYIIMANEVGKGHVKLVIGGEDGSRMKAIAFRALEHDWGHALISGVGKHFHFAGKLKKDDWKNDGSVEMVVDDVAFARGGN